MIHGFSLFLCILMLVPTSLTAKFSFKKVSSYFNAMPHETVVQKSFPCKTPGTLIVENLDGTINIKTEWNQNSIILSAVKKAARPEQLQDIQFTVEPKSNTITIKTSYNPKKVTGAVDYTLIVPATMQLDLTTHQGTIIVHNAQGTITALTHQGNIELYGTKGIIDATCKMAGSIAIHQPLGPINARAHKGSITVYDARDSVIAHTQNGAIELFCKKVPATGKLVLKTVSGPIKLHLPSNTNAELSAKTDRGSLISHHLVTVKPFTTELNPKAWRKFQKEVQGTLGTGEADIKLFAQHGSIKILNYA